MKKDASAHSGTTAAATTQSAAFVGMPELVERALEISAKRRETLERLRAALEQSDDIKALQIARELCGVTNEKESDRVDPRVH